MEPEFTTVSNISFCNYVQKKPKDRNEVYIKDNALIFVRKGIKILHLANKSLETKEEYAVFLRSGNYIMSEVLDNYFESLVFFYEDDLLLDFINKYKISFEDDEKENLNVFKIENSKELKSIIDLTCQYFTGNLPNKEQLIKLKLEEAFLNILNRDKSNDFLNFLHSVSKANNFKTFVKKEFKYNENILDMAIKLKIPESSFREKFKEEFKTKPKKWQTQKRLERAKTLLETTSKNVSEVCMDVGFDNISWFIQVFKKEYNLTPKQIKTNKN